MVDWQAPQAQASPAITAYAIAVRRLCDAPISEDPTQLASDLIQLRHCTDLIELLFSRMAHKFADSDEYEADGSASPISWLRNNCKMGSGAAADRVCVGRLAEPLAESIDALREAEIGFAHLALMGRTAERISPNKELSVDDLRRLLVLAKEQNMTHFRKSCEHYRHSEDQQGFVDDEIAVHELRELYVGPGLNGGFCVRGRLDSEGGAILVTALDAMVRKQPKESQTIGQRMADALVDMAEATLQHGDLPKRGGRVPHLTVTATLETLLGLTGSPAADVEVGTPISYKTVERLACDCSLTRVLLGPDSAILDVGRARRVISPSQRRALAVRDKGCIFPGCTRPAWACTGHHFRHWIWGGGSDLENLGLLCKAHHYFVHEGGWSIRRTDDGRVIVLPPTSRYGLWEARARAPSSDISP